MYKSKTQNADRNRNIITVNSKTNNCTCFMVAGKTKQELIADWDYVQKQL